jgi:hypothetical protein
MGTGFSHNFGLYSLVTKINFGLIDPVARILCGHNQKMQRFRSTSSEVGIHYLKANVRLSHAQTALKTEAGDQSSASAFIVMRIRG